MIGRQSTGRFIAEIILIILGVLLGIMANEWREGRARSVEARRGLAAIATEIRGNRSQVDQVLDLHEALLDSLQGLLRRMTAAGTTPDFQALTGVWSGGYPMPLLETANWEAANSTGISGELDFSLTRGLVRYYSLVSFCQDKLDRIGENLYVATNIDPDHRHGLILAITLTTNDIIIQEKRLLEISDKLLEQLPRE